MGSCRLYYTMRICSLIILSNTTSVWATGMLSQGYMGAPSYHSTGQFCPRFGKSGSFMEWRGCHNIMGEADVNLWPLPKLILDIYKVFEPLVCCLKGIWVHPYTVQTSQVGPRLGNPGSLVEWKCPCCYEFQPTYHKSNRVTSIQDWLGPQYMY